MYLFFGPLMVIFCCDLTIRESKKLLKTCFKLDQYLPLESEESRELKSLTNIIKSRRPVFTAAGFFQVNRATLLSLFGTTTTYFIIIVQFGTS
ncbi:hypothetical protein NQ314_008652 [Rhamnusium bicolor]|uniref:Uncharacterized protein n=1 Tax=Rhamnusium bicolor TaxID=1586634 RepID=A0AAV8Y8G6_9CUCU|nr:hypothetical protein NQ314_008652 [Rhamnusium bicolor]